MKLYPLSKAVLSIRHNPALFLNGLSVNTVNQPRNAFVNIHGRIVATFDQYRVSDDEFIIVLEEAFVEPLLSHLQRYIALSGVRIERLDRYVYFDIGEDVTPIAGALAIPQKKGRLLVSQELMPSQVSDEEFTLFRLKNNIPVQGIDYRDEFLLNVSEEEFVSFAKGCFLGQEPLAKVHHRSKPSWRLVVRFEDECTPEEQTRLTSLTLDPQIGRKKGFVFIKNQ